MIGHSSDITGAHDLISENRADQPVPICVDPEPFDQVVAGAGLYEADLGVFKIPDAVDDGIHRPVSSQDDETAFLSA